MTLDEATDIVREQARESGVEMVVVRGYLSKDAGAYEYCAAMYVSTRYSEHHGNFWDIVGRSPPDGSPSLRRGLARAILRHRPPFPRRPGGLFGP
jgi:hypothetical protein